MSLWTQTKTYALVAVVVAVAAYTAWAILSDALRQGATP